MSAALVTYHDRQADILYVELRNSAAARSIEYDWGLIDLGDDGEPVGVEYWDASEHLPSELLGALPAPRPSVQAAAPAEGRRHGVGS